jgi:DNA-binding PadR family transcriptional regulator
MAFRGYLKLMILRILKDKPMSGYELMKTISKKTGSKPSAGSTYPLLEELRKKKMVQVRNMKRKKIYTLTKIGKLQLKDVEKKKHELLDSMVKRARAIDHIFSMNISPFMKMIHDRAEMGQFPFDEMRDEIFGLSAAIVNLMENDKINKNKKKIQEILREATRKLNRLK